MRCFPFIFWLISLLPVSDQGKYHLTGSEGPIKAQVGSDVVLPCSVEPPADMRDAVVDWMFNFSKTVHVFRNEADDLKSQDERYKDRTSLNHKMIEHGDASLTLVNVTKNDAGIYTCFVLRRPGLSEERNVILVVVDGNENPDRHSGGGTGDNNNGDDPGVNAGVNVAGGVGGVIVLGVVGAVAFIIIYVVRRCKGEQIFQRWINKSPNEEVRNDEWMEIEQLQNHRGNGNQGDEAEPLQNQEEPN